MLHDPHHQSEEMHFQGYGKKIPVKVSPVVGSEFCRLLVSVWVVYWLTLTSLL